MIHDTTMRLIDQIEQSAAEHRDHVARIRQAGRDAADAADISAETILRAELRAKSIAAHPSRVALRNEVAAENLRRRGLFVAGPSPADRVAEFDARVIDLAERRGGRA